MRKWFFPSIALYLILFFSFLEGIAGAREFSQIISPDEFKYLAEELAPKVNLFHDAWKQDPQAEFFGGTTRDYVYWLKGQFKNIATREEAEKQIAKLRALPSIDVRDFIIGDSDVDIVGGSADLRASDYGLKKIDFIDGDRFNINTVSGKNEIDQGFIPVEKIRLGQNGFKPVTSFGDGVAEIHAGRLSVHFPDAAKFKETHYAKLKLNHEILLALRYLRVIAMNYFYEHGSGYPNESFRIDEKTAAQLEALIKRVRETRELNPYLREPKFQEWINAAIKKTFRSYTNPTAAHILFKRFGLEQLIQDYGLEPINSYLFAKHRNEELIARNIQSLGVDKKNIFIEPKIEFSDMRLYHGTKTEEAFRSILLQGILPSENGAAGGGLYGVAQKNLSFAQEWGGDKNRVVVFNVKPEAKIVDITRGEGAKAFEVFKTKHGKDYNHFADFIGADIIKYPYDLDAFVVKNSAVLSYPAGHTRGILSLGKALLALEKVSSSKEVSDLLQQLDMNRYTNAELKHILQALHSKLAYPEISQAVERLSSNSQFALLATHYKKVMESTTPVEFLSSITQIHKSKLKSSKELADQVLFSTYQSFFSMQPSDSELQQLYKMTGNYSIALEIQKNRLRQAKSVGAYQAIATLKKDGIFTDHKWDNSVLVQGVSDTFDHYLDISNRDFNWITQFYKLVQKKEQGLEENLNEIFLKVKNPSEIRSLVGIVPIRQKLLDSFMEKDLSPESLLELGRYYFSYNINTEKLESAIFSRQKSSAEFVKTAENFYRRGSNIPNKFNLAIEKHLDHFLALNPTSQELEALRNTVNNIYVSSAILAEELKRAQSKEEYLKLAALEVTNEGNSISWTNRMKMSAIADSLGHYNTLFDDLTFLSKIYPDKLFNMSDEEDKLARSIEKMVMEKMSKVSAIEQFMNIAEQFPSMPLSQDKFFQLDPSREQMMRMLGRDGLDINYFVKSLLESAKSAEEFIAVVEKMRTTLHSYNEKTRNCFNIIYNQFNHFLSLNPSYAELSRMRNAARYADLSRLAFAAMLQKTKSAKEFQDLLKLPFFMENEDWRYEAETLALAEPKSIKHYLDLSSDMEWLANYVKKLRGKFNNRSFILVQNDFEHLLFQARTPEEFIIASQAFGSLKQKHLNYFVGTLKASEQQVKAMNKKIFLEKPCNWYFNALEDGKTK